MFTFCEGAVWTVVRCKIKNLSLHFRRIRISMITGGRWRREENVNKRWSRSVWVVQRRWIFFVFLTITQNNMYYICTALINMICTTLLCRSASLFVPPQYILCNLDTAYPQENALTTEIQVENIDFCLKRIMFKTAKMGINERIFNQWCVQCNQPWNSIRNRFHTCVDS